MSNDTLVTLYKGGTKEITLPVAEMKIPDVWKICDQIEEHLQAIATEGNTTFNEEAWAIWRDQLVSTWHIAGHLWRHIRETK